MKHLQHHKVVGKWMLVLVLAAAAASPFIASAAINYNVWNPSILQGPLITCTGTGGGSSGLPACQSLCDLMSTAINVVYFLIGFVIWVITPILVAWSGALFMLSQGNPGRQSDARKMVTGVAIGLLIVLCAYLIVYTFVSVLGISGIGGFGTTACPISMFSPNGLAAHKII